MTELAIGIRYALTGIVLMVVWTHTHWSVALAVTGLSIIAELVQFQIKRRIR